MPVLLHMTALSRPLCKSPSFCTFVTAAGVWFGGSDDETEDLFFFSFPSLRCTTLSLALFQVASDGLTFFLSGRFRNVV